MGKVYKNKLTNVELTKATKDISLEELMKQFKIVSDKFFDEYRRKVGKGDSSLFQPHNWLWKSVVIKFDHIKKFIYMNVWKLIG